ncbi:aminoglycoside phosphotransferase family protein [Actinomadura harenae]|uniref:Aminoglycoside phosphotransferase family protein n=1 Tax=Actinomadura harenae TaxID=2483351 RepID=A0A3M2MDZ8_9ACTN|nr:aminoglycoside phosphotransferase family protein [Actinomadura harenae]RMI47210.1 aminoglycoside phosphotransferase family protein [Actinomadura harenae]
MSLEPRFRRVAAMHRRFVDREPVLEAFAGELESAGAGPRVFNVVGVGGIGKSRLLRELVERVKKTRRTATLDLQVPAMRQQEDALAVLRVGLGRQGVRFDRFDIAYAVWWQRLHPHLRLTRSQLPFIAESEALTQILDGAAGVPVFGTGVGLVRLLEKVSTSARQRHRIKHDETLSALDELGNAELADAVTFLFAEDLRAASAERGYVVLVDAYEALRRGAASDVWLRDLVAQLDRGLTVVASREPVEWHAHDASWRPVVREVRVDGLPMQARLELLADGGIDDLAVREAIAVASQGLPFYLHLAVDTRTTARQSAAVSSEEILQRFLAHVAAEEIRTLELLSVARVFDYEIFQAVADAFDLPRHRMAWESLTAYSFVYPAGTGGLRLHQLMREALHRRLSRETMADVHLVLKRVWDDRVGRRQTSQDGIATRARAVREAVYSGLHARVVDGDGVLSYADQALACGGKQAVDGIVADLRRYLETHPSPRLELVARCLQAEAAIVLGDATSAVRLTPRLDWPTGDGVGARLALAAAHGRRIAGDTSEALAVFHELWDTDAPGVGLRAGFCVADLDMWQGRFRDAFAMTDRILEATAPDDHLLRGDVWRLRHLGYRFALDLTASERALDEAEEIYRRAGTLVEAALVKTNRIELFAWTDPDAAVEHGAAAIAAQTDLGALHEIGKTYTALAIALTRLGRHDRAAAAFETAADFLDRARYRSGRARAELFRALLHVRTGYPHHALASARWAVSELVAAEVYPTLIMMAGQVLDVIGLDDDGIAEAARAATTRIDALDSLDGLQGRTRRLIADLLGEHTP